MSTIELWDDPQDYIVLSGQQSPGLAEISGAAAVLDYRIHESPVMTGAVAVFKKRKLATFKVKFSLFTREDFEAFDTFRIIFDTLPSPLTRANALRIEHPLLADIGITMAMVTEISQLEPDGLGGLSMTVSFREHRGIPVQSEAKVEAAKPKAKTANERIIEENDAKIKKALEELAK